MNVSVGYGRCRITILGTDMKCPLCGSLVKSGQTHECTSPQQALLPHRIQRKRVRGWKMPLNTVYVGRPTIWGNPFIPHNGDCSHPDCGPNSHPPLTRQGAVDAYRIYLPGLLAAQDKRLIETLRGKNLACWCPLDVPCHADVLLEVANSEGLVRR